MKHQSVHKAILLIMISAAVGICLLLGIRVQKFMCDDVYIVSFLRNDRFFDSDMVAKLEEEGAGLTYIRYLNPVVTNGFRTEKATVIATNENYSYFTGMGMKADAFFNGIQADKSLPVAVLNETAAYQLFGNHKCIGKKIYLDQNSLEVVGISKNSTDEGTAEIFISDRTAKSLNITGSEISQLWCQFDNMAEAALMISKMGYSMEEMNIWQIDLYKRVFLQRFSILLILLEITFAVKILHTNPLCCQFRGKMGIHINLRDEKSSVLHAFANRGNKKQLILRSLQLLGLIGCIICTLQILKMAWCIPPNYYLNGKSGIQAFYEILEFYTLSGVEIDNMLFLDHWNLLSLFCFIIFHAGVMLYCIVSSKGKSIYGNRR